MTAVLVPHRKRWNSASQCAVEPFCHDCTGVAKFTFASRNAPRTVKSEKLTIRISTKPEKKFQNALSNSLNMLLVYQSESPCAHAQDIFTLRTPSPLAHPRAYARGFTQTRRVAVLSVPIPSQYNAAVEGHLSGRQRCPSG